MSKRYMIWLFVGLGIVGVAIAVAVALNRDEGGWTSATRPTEVLMGELVTTPTAGEEILLPGETVPFQEPEGGQSTPQTEVTETPTEQKPTPTEPAPPPQTEAAFLRLPYKIPGTGLVLDRLDSYAGIYVEQGTDIRTDNVAMILLHNEAESVLEYGLITITLDNGTELEFEPTCLPVDGKMVVQERSCKAFDGGQILSCWGEIAALEEFPMSRDQVKVTENQDSSLTVTNLTDQSIAAVRVFYKLYMEAEDGYVGGITYTAKVSNLAPGATTTVKPTHYLYGSCRVVMVRTYETGD